MPCVHILCDLGAVIRLLSQLLFVGTHCVEKKMSENIDRCD